MDQEVSEQVSTPAIVMMASGGISALFYLGYVLWSGIPMAMQLLNVVVGLMAAMSDSNGAANAMITIACGAWGILLNGVGVLIYLALVGAGAFVVTGGMSFQKLEDIEKVRKCMMLAAAIPVIGILANVLTTLAQISCCGLVVGTAPQLLPLALGIAAAFLANTALQEPAVESAFQS